MNWQFTPYLLLPLLAAILLGALAFFGWRRRPAPGASAFVLLMLSVAEWSLGNALELGTADLPGKIFWLNIEYIGIVALPAAWLIFALQYTERGNWLTRRTLTLLAVEPALALILLWTTGVHGLFFSDLGLDTSGPVPQWDGVNGIGYWINIIYSYILIFTGTLILLQALVRSQGSRLYRWRAFAVLAGVLSPWVANVLYIFYGLPLPGLDPTPFALAVTGLAFAWGIFRLQLFDIVPAAHEAVPENLGEWREQVLDNILNGVLVFGLLVLAGGINNVIQAYRQAASLYDRPLVLALAIITAYVAATLAVFIAAFWRGPGYAWRAGTLLFVFYGLGALGLALSGLSGDGRLFLFAFVILTAILFDLPYGLGALTLSVLTFAVMAWLLVNGAIQLPGLRQSNPVDPSGWWGGVLVFVLLTVGAVTSVTYLMKRLERSLTQAQTELAERRRAEAALRENEKNTQSLLRLSKRLEQAQTYTEALDAVLEELKSVLGYQTAWVYLMSENKQYAHLLSTRGKHSQFGEELSILTIKGDRFLEEIAAGGDIVVVEDARLDPRTNKEIVARRGNRTILNVPIVLMDRHLGALGTGTFDDEGVRLPAPTQLDYLRALASHLAVALDRIHLFTERRRAEESLLASEAHLQRLNRVLRAISAINQLIVRERDRKQLLAEACQIFIRERDYAFVWIGLLEADGLTVRLAAASGPADPAHFHFRLDKPGLGPACAPAALRARLPFQVEPSPENDPCPNCPLRASIPQRSSVALPLTVGERIFGAMVIHAPTPNLFNADEIQFLQELANDLAYALEKLEVEEQRRACESELALLLDAARVMSTRLDPDEVLRQLAFSMMQALRLESCTLSAYDPETRGTLTLVNFSAPGESDMSDIGQLYPLTDYPATARAIDQDETLIVRVGNPQADQAEADLLRTLGFAVLLMFPLRVGGRMVGLAELYTRDEGREFPAAELRLARTLADQAAVALENARLFSETQTKAAELSRLYAAAQDMTTSLESPRLLELLAKHLAEALGATSAYIGSVDVDQATETMMAEYWAEAATPVERTSDLGRAFSLRQYPTVLQAALSGQTITLQADSPNLSEAERRQFTVYAVQTMLFLPITAHGRLLALAEIWESRRKRLFTPAEIRLAQALAAHAGSAIENAQLFAETASALTREQHLNTIARLISGTLDQPALLQNVVRLAAELIGAEAGAIALVAPDRLTMTIPYLYNLPEGLGNDLTPTGIGLAWRIVESGETILLGDFSAHPDVRPGWAAIGLRGFVGAPIVAGEARLGAIGLFSLHPAKRFTERDAALARSIGQQAGLAIRNAQLFEAVQQREAFFRSLAENALDAVAILDAGAVFRYHSPSVERVLGYKPEELLNQNAFEFIHPEDAPHVMQSFAAGIQNPGVIEKLEFRARHRDGSWLVLEAIAHNLLADSRVAGVVLNYRDITHRRQAEESLRASEARFRAVIEQSNEGISVADQQGRYVLVNPAFCALTGYGEEELLTMRVFDLLPSHVNPELFEQVAKLNQAGQREAELQRKDGSTFYALISGAPIQLEEGRFVLGLVQDMTARRQAEEDLRQSEARYRFLYDDNPAIYFTVDAAGVILSVNRFGAHYLGYTREELIGQPVVSLFYPDDRPTVLQKMSALLRHATSERQWELRKVRKDGSVLWVRESVRTARDTDGQTVILIVCADVTEQRQAEDSLRRRADEFAALYETARHLSVQRDLPTLLQFIVERAAALLNTTGGGIYLYDAPRGLVELVVTHHSPLPIGTQLALGEGMAGRVAQSRQPLIVDDHRLWPGRSPRFEGVPITAVAQVPLLYGGELIGVLFVHEIGEATRKFTDADARLLSLFAALAAGAVRDTRLHDETRRRAVELEALAQVASALRGAGSVDEMLPVIVREAAEAVGGNFGAIFLLEPETGDLVSRGWLAAGTGWQFAGDRTAALLRHRLGEGITGHVAATGEIHITFDLHNDPIAFILSGEADYASAVHGGISLPLRAQQQVVGVLHVWLAEPRSASDSEMRLLTAIAEMGGNAIHRATLHEQTLRHADELALAYDRTLEGWAHALELRDELTEGHTRRVTEMTLKLAAALGMAEEQLVHVRRGALLHDIGKMGIPDSILLKPGPLTVIEMDIMRRHPQYAYNMLSPIPFLRPALDIPRYHHEKWDGTGYPRGLKGEQIPLAARIFAVADVWDALTFDRPYREAWPAEEVRQFIREQSERHFDPQVAEAFLRLLNDRDLV